MSSLSKDFKSVAKSEARTNRKVERRQARARARSREGTKYETRRFVLVGALAGGGRSSKSSRHASEGGGNSYAGEGCAARLEVRKDGLSLLTLTHSLPPITLPSYPTQPLPDQSNRQGSVLRRVVNIGDRRYCMLGRVEACSMAPLSNSICLLEAQTKAAVPHRPLSTPPRAYTGPPCPAPRCRI